MGWYTKKAQVQSEPGYPYYLAIHTEGRLKGQAPMNIRQVPHLRREWDRGGMGTGRTTREFKGDSPREVLAQLSQAGITPPFDDVNFYEVSFRNAPRVGLQVQRFMSMARGATSSQGLSKEAEWPPKWTSDKPHPTAVYIDTGFWKVPVSLAKEMCAGVLPREGFEKHVLWGGRRWVVGRTRVFGETVWAIRERQREDMVTRTAQADDIQDILGEMIEDGSIYEKQNTLPGMPPIAPKPQFKVPPGSKDSMAEIVSNKYVTTRKPHNCAICNDLIETKTYTPCISVHRRATHIRLGYYFCKKHNPVSSFNHVKEKEFIA